MNKKYPGSISFIMAGYNEERIAYQAVRAVIEALDPAFEQFEIILVDDGSTDGTLSEMKRCAREDSRVRVLENGVNLNYGASVLRGLTAARNDWVFYDAFDLEMDPKDLVRLFPAAGSETDVVVYERETYEAVVWRRFASLLNRGLLHLFFPFLMRGTPVLNHTQLFRRRIIRDIMPLSRSPIFFAPEMIFRAKAKELKWENRKVPFHSIDGVRKGAFGHVYDILWAVTDMLRFRIRLWRRKV